MTAASPERESWILRLCGPLLGWAVAALVLWKWLDRVVVLTPETAALLTLLAVFITSSIYIYLACRRGEYPRRAWWLALLALLLSIGIGLFLQANLAQSILFLLAAPLFGDMLSRLVEKKEYLLPVFAVAVIADTWSVFLGPSRAAVEAGISQYVSVSYPVTGYAAALPVPVAGIMDWIFFAFFVSVVVRFKLSRWKLWPAALLGITVGVVYTSLTNSPFPFLAVLAPAFGIFYFFEITPSWKELLITLIFIIVMLAIFATFGYVYRQANPAPEAPVPQTRPAEPLPQDPAAATPQLPQIPAAHPL